MGKQKSSLPQGSALPRGRGGGHQRAPRLCTVPREGEVGIRGRPGSALPQGRRWASEGPWQACTQGSRTPKGKWGTDLPPPRAPPEGPERTSPQRVLPDRGSYDEKGVGLWRPAVQFAQHVWGSRPSARHPRVRDNPLSTQASRPQHHLPRTCYRLTPHPSIPPQATRGVAPATREVALVPWPPHGAPESLSRGQWIDSHSKC